MINELSEIFTKYNLWSPFGFIIGFITGWLSKKIKYKESIPKIKSMDNDYYRK